MQFGKPAETILFLIPFLLAGPSFGREIIHLNTGFELQAQSHQQNGATVLLQTQTGTLELPAAAITGIDILPDPPGSVAAMNPSAEPTLAALLQSGAASQGTAPEFIRFVKSVALVESALHPQALSPRGAVGLMQLMPQTAKELGVDPTDIKKNIEGGAKYLRSLLLRYNNDSVLALAAYNAGPGAVSRFSGVPPYVETRRYIEKVLREYAREGASGDSRAEFSDTGALRSLHPSSK